MNNAGYKTLHIRVPFRHVTRINALGHISGEAFGFQARFVRRAVETQLMLEEYTNGIQRKELDQRAVHSLSAALAAGIDEALRESAGDEDDRSDSISEEDIEIEDSQATAVAND